MGPAQYLVEPGGSDYYDTQTLNSNVKQRCTSRS